MFCDQPTMSEQIEFTQDTVVRKEVALINGRIDYVMQETRDATQDNNEEEEQVYHLSQLSEDSDFDFGRYPSEKDKDKDESVDSEVDSD